MTRKHLMIVALAVVSFGSLTACSGDSSSTSTTPAIGLPDPPLPSDVNAIPFVSGAIAAAGNADVRMQLLPESPVDDPDVLVLDVQVTSGALEPFDLTPEMFRVYTLDGKSYTPEAVGEIERFGESTLNTGETYEGLLAVRVTTGSVPALFLADLTDLGERFFAVAFSLDPDFVPEAPES